MLGATLTGGPRAAVVFAVLAVAFPAGLMTLGAMRGGSRALWPICALLVWLELGLAGMLALRGSVAAGPWILGLPAAAAILVYGYLFVPLALVALGYAWTSRSFLPSREELDRLRELARRRGGD